MDENAERRNHYLDLAGIENYASKFDEAGIQAPGVGPYKPSYTVIKELV